MAGKAPFALWISATAPVARPIPNLSCLQTPGQQIAQGGHQKIEPIAGSDFACHQDLVAPAGPGIIRDAAGHVVIDAELARRGTRPGSRMSLG
jgi:hypothetical protein